MTHKWLKDPLTGGVALVCLLWMGRAAMSGSLYFGFLLWNLLLACIPMLISHWLIARRKVQTQGRIMPWIWLAAWLICFPNAPYIITDLQYIADEKLAYGWYDIVMLFAAALTGLHAGYRSLQQVTETWQHRFGGWWPRLFLPVVYGLSGLGIYLGRELRFNSWEVLTQPGAIADACLRMLFYPDAHLRGWAFTVLFALLLWTLQPLMTNLPLRRQPAEPS
jgi:uncharacterized membrane protein